LNVFLIIIIAAVTAAALVLIIIIPLWLVRIAARPKNMESSEIYERESKRGNTGDYNKLPQMPLEVRMEDGYIIHGVHIPNGGNRFVILTHGYIYCMYGNIKYLHMYRSMGFDVIMYDNRGCGSNAPAGNTMGAVESRDLLTLIEYVRGRFGKDVQLGLHGESQGAATTLMCLKYRPDVDFVVSDCAYGNVDDFFREMIKKRFHLPGFVASLAFCYGRWFFDFDVNEMKPIDAVKTTDVPVCVIHGDADAVVSVRFAGQIAEACGGYSELHIVHGAEHARSFETSPEKYRQFVENFLKH